MIFWNRLSIIGPRTLFWNFSSIIGLDHNFETDRLLLVFDHTYSALIGPRIRVFSPGVATVPFPLLFQKLLALPYAKAVVGIWQRSLLFFSWFFASPKLTVSARRLAEPNLNYVRLTERKWTPYARTSIVGWENRAMTKPGRANLITILKKTAVHTNRTPLAATVTCKI